MPKFPRQITAEMGGVSHCLLDLTAIFRLAEFVRQSSVEVAVILHGASAHRTRDVPCLSTSDKQGGG